MTLDEAGRNVGARVVYSGGAANEYGVINAVNASYVFVRYTSSGSKATRASDLEFAVAGDAA